MARIRHAPKPSITDDKVSAPETGGPTDSHPRRSSMRKSGVAESVSGTLPNGIHYTIIGQSTGCAGRWWREGEDEVPQGPAHLGTNTTRAAHLSLRMPYLAVVEVFATASDALSRAIEEVVQETEMDPESFSSSVDREAALSTLRLDLQFLDIRDAEPYSPTPDTTAEEEDVETSQAFVVGWDGSGMQGTTEADLAIDDKDSTNGRTQVDVTIDKTSETTEASEVPRLERAEKLAAATRRFCDTLYTEVEQRQTVTLPSAPADDTNTGTTASFAETHS